MDARLRTLERAARTGDRQARIAWVRAQVRAGVALDPELTLAAYCGHDQALTLAVDLGVPERASTWLRGLDRWGLHVCVIASTAIARAVWWYDHDLSYALRRNDRQVYRELVWALEHWAECACADHAREVEVLAEVASRFLRDRWEGSFARWAAGAVHRESEVGEALRRWPEVVPVSFGDDLRAKVERAILARLVLIDLL